MRDPPIETTEDLGCAVFATGPCSFDRQQLAAFENLADRLSGLGAHRDIDLISIEGGSSLSVPRSIRSAKLRGMADTAKRFAERVSDGGK